MKRVMRIASIIALAVFMSTTAMAAVGWEVVQEFKTGATPLDITATPDGNSTYILTNNGEIQLFSADGKLKGTIPVDKNVDRISLSDGGKALLLMNSKTSQIQKITVSFQFAIKTSGSPTKGKLDAPVVIAVFSDFQ